MSATITEIVTATVTDPAATSSESGGDINSDMDLGLGFIGIGVFINCMILGIIIVMVNNYYSNYGNDRIALKLLVGVTFILNIFNSVLNCGSFYRWTITYFGNYDRISISDFFWNMKSFNGGSLVLLVQCFYAWRIYQLNGHSIWIPALVALIAFWQFGFAMAVTALTFTHHGIIITFKSFAWVISCWLVGAAVGDVVIAASMIYYLRRTRRELGGNAGNIFNRLVRIVIQTNIFTAVVAIVDIICYNVMTNSVHSAFLINLGPLITLGLLVSLNSRARLKKYMKGVRNVDHPSGIELSTNQQDSTSKDSDYSRGGIQVFTNTEINREPLGGLKVKMDDAKFGNTTQVVGGLNSSALEREKSQLELERTESEDSSNGKYNVSNTYLPSSRGVGQPDEYGTRAETWAEPPAHYNHQQGEQRSNRQQPNVTVQFPPNLNSNANTNSVSSTPSYASSPTAYHPYQYSSQPNSPQPQSPTVVVSSHERPNEYHAA